MLKSWWFLLQKRADRPSWFRMSTFAPALINACITLFVDQQTISAVHVPYHSNAAGCKFKLAPAAISEFTSAIFPVLAAKSIVN